MKLNKRVKQIALAAVAVAVGWGAVTLVAPANKQEIKDLPVVKAIVYRSPTCGCCGNYLSYLKKNGFDASTEWAEDNAERRTRFSIPGDMASCHTTVVGDYVIEGHVPVEAIRKLLDEKPAGLRGIAMPGMPSGSPGMPGPKKDEFVIYGLTAEGTGDVFMTI